MSTIAAVPIIKTDVLTEDFTNINTLIRQIVSDRQQLLELRNSWEVFFMGYDDDPREIPEIPEVVNWYERSIEEGIPWFYFMRTDYPKSMGLAVFMMCCAGVRDSETVNRYTFDEEKIQYFINENLNNLADFVHENDIPDEISVPLLDEVMRCVKTILYGEDDNTPSDSRIDEQKMISEAMERLEMLENQFGLNPKVRNYFREGKLYYSYLTAGGMMGSIDTIHYDERYARIAESFEEQTSYLVYHVIERGDRILLLFVGDDYANWQKERPANGSVLAMMVNVNTGENKAGYVLLDVLQGALYPKTDEIFADRPGNPKTVTGLTEIDAEIIERLEILKETGIETDLDITSVYLNRGEICASILTNVYGTPVCVINTISSIPSCQQIAEMVEEKLGRRIYFVMSSVDDELVFLFVTDRTDSWEMEKLALEKKKPMAIVLNLDDGSAEIRRISFEIMNGGPLKTEDL